MDGERRVKTEYVLFGLIIILISLTFIERVQTDKYVNELETELTILQIDYNNLIYSLRGYDNTKKNYEDLIKDYSEVVIRFESLKQQPTNKCELYNASGDIYHVGNANGLYWRGTDFYCVWADKRTLTQQQETEYHEHCHYLINEDFNHFCTDDDIIKITR